MASVPKIVKGLQKANRDAWPTTLTFFDWASGVRSTPRETTFEELQAALKMTKSETREFAADIEAAGIGIRIFGRRGFKSRIKWEYTLQSVAKAARGMSESLELLSQGNLPAAAESSEAGGYSNHPNDADHVFQLRSSRRVNFRLPKDLTAKEADRLAAFIKTLPLE
ncbi:hypothetical protein [Bradyrhizobium sp. AZCC 2289]|uniref:hypothetical protein n=1 Tax=Bradyrhizobium sp. AZCC 2289 TaxID=3117026 RepID=UPI002FF0FA3D